MRRSVLLIAVALLGAIAACMVAPQSVARESLHLLIAVTTLPVGIFIAMWLWEARRHQRLAAEMGRLAYQGALVGQPVHFVRGLSGPLVAGLWAPRIFCGDDLDGRLDQDELWAVMLHERHHVRDRAPLRLVGLAALAPVVGCTSAGRAWLERERARIEIAADRHALAEGVSRPAIASALLKLGARASASAPGFTTAADLRIQALLGEPIGLHPDRRVRWTAAAVLLLAACLLVYLA